MMLLYLEKMERTRKYLDEDLEDEKIRQDVEQFVLVAQYVKKLSLV